MYKFIKLVLLLSLADLYHQNIILDGPGLKPNEIQLAARYFFVNFTFLNEENYRKEDIDKLEIEIGGNTKTRDYCRIWTNKLDRKDGTVIVRYKIYEVCHNLVINVQYKGKHIGKSPYRFAGPTYADQCNCPEVNFEKWMIQNGCETTYKQMDEDLKYFKNVDMDQLVQKIVNKYHKPESTSFCHYAIKDNEIYRDCYGKHVGFNMFSDNILQFLSRKVFLPNFEFVINLGDWPLVKEGHELLPIFSWCGSNDTKDIIMPTYDITESTLENMGRVTLDTLSVQGSIEKRWSEREPKAVWRGRDSRVERLKLIDIARAYPELVNASLTNFFFFKHKEAEYGPKQPHMSFFKFFDFKYQVNVDGTVAAYRLPYLLAGGGMVLKQESPYYEHFYRELEPWVHYVPVARDLHDLPDRVRWALHHDLEAKNIAKNAREFANKHLLPQHIVCYHAALFWEWSKRIVNDVKVRDGMTRVPQPEADCECSPNTSKDEL